MKLRKGDQKSLHQGVWFLLLLKNGGRGVEFLGSCQYDVRLIAGIACGWAEAHTTFFSVPEASLEPIVSFHESCS